MPTKIEELRGTLDEKRTTLAEVFEQAGDDYDMSKVTSLEGDSAAKAAQIKAMNDEMTALGKEIDGIDDLASIRDGVASLDAIERPMKHPAGGSRQDRQVAEVKSIGELFVDSVALKGWKPGMDQGPVADLEDVDVLATLFETGAGWAPATVRGPQVVDYATRPISVVDLFPKGETSQPSLVYMEETTVTNNAAEVAEGGSKPEAALVLTERTEAVRKIAVTLPVTDEQLEDVPRIRSYLDNRLGFMVEQRLDSQVLVGDGTAPNISGILDRSGIQTQAKGADPTPDAVYKAMTKIRVNAFSVANAAVFHPNDWQDIRLLRTADGIYIWGSPADAGPERIWGLAVAQSTGLTENTGLVGDFRQTELVTRKGLSLSIGYVNDDFKKNRQTLRAEMRVALCVYRPAAFATVTGI